MTPINGKIAADAHKAFIDEFVPTVYDPAFGRIPIRFYAGLFIYQVRDDGRV